MNHAIKDYVSGDYVMCLDADSILHPKSIERAVNYLKNKQIIGVAANVRIIGDKSLLGKLQRFEHMVGYRSKKFYSLANCEFIIGGVASTYRRSILKKVKFYDNDTMTEDIGLSLKIVATTGNKNQRVYYASDVVAFTEGVQNFKDLLRQRYRWKMGSLQNLFKYRSLIGEYQPTFYSRALTLYRLPMAILSEVLLILEPLILGYIIYLSIAFHTLGIVFGAYLTITVYIMTVLWSDEHLPTKDKLRMSVSALWIYVLFYIMDVVQTAAMIKSLRLYKKIIHRGSDLSTWVSPKRAKQIQAI
jgi:cellulose synthase/poly-beta-1,6-N-acetylglucosamine synthase-like glycosyltransferase